MDDAGVGYAGLSHILRHPSDAINLDIALSRDSDSSPGMKRPRAAALASFAAEMGAVIIGGGFETAADLAALGVGAGQGCHLGHPGPLPVSAAAARHG